jgi:hypothetical protein
MSEPAARNVYRVYSARAQFLLGNISSRKVRAALRARGYAFDELRDPVIPRRTTYVKPVAITRKLPLVVVGPTGNTEFREIDHDGMEDEQENGEAIPEAERWRAVVHAFSHALRNLVRYRSGNAPLPWTPDCAGACLAARNKLYRGGHRR